MQMSMRMSIHQATIAVLAGCGVTATTEHTTSDPPALAAMATGPTAQASGGCPDPLTDCTHSNGSGVYFEEGGNAGINALQFPMMMMITEFTNQGSTVTFKGRYADPVQRGRWLWAEGTIVSADYTDGRGLHPRLQLVKLTEDLTKPNVTLVDPGSPGTPVRVIGDDLVLLQLQLHATVEVPPLATVHVVLDFNRSDVIYDTDPAGHVFFDHPVLYAYNLRWRPDVSSPPTPTQYCYRGPSAPGGPPEPDQVVFQREIAVDPVTGTVTSAPGSVTMSCAWGAVAKAYNFGYRYADPADGSAFDRSFYEAAIHMKRAAYCGGFAHYTARGVRIGIHDSSSINRYPPDPPNLEARWSSRGATCVNLGKLRLPGSGFDGHCSSRWSPPPCAASETTYLEDYIPPAP
jgi:hypothetical protein